jgi:hypothetical protein
VRVLDPRDVFPEYNINSPYVKDSQRIVVRSYLTKEEILSQYGKEMSSKDRETIKEHWDHIQDNGAYYMKG